MALVPVTINVSQSVNDLGQKLAAIVVALKSLPPGASALADVVAVAGPLLSELSQIIQDVQALPADEKANLLATIDGCYVAGRSIVLAAL